MPDGNLTITLSVTMWQTIGAVLENAPYKIAAPVLAELQKQIDAQNRGVTATVPSPAPQSDE